MTMRDGQMLVLLRLAGMKSLRGWLKLRRDVVATLRNGLRHRGRGYSLRRGDGLLYCATEGPHPRDLVTAILLFERTTRFLLRGLRSPEHAHIEVAARRRMALKAKRSYGAVMRTYTRTASRPPPDLTIPRWLTRRDPLHMILRPRLSPPSTT